MVSRLGAGPSSTGDSVGNDHTPRWICSTTRESQGRFNATIERSNGTGRPGGRRHAETADRPPGDGGEGGGAGWTGRCSTATARRDLGLCLSRSGRGLGSRDACAPISRLALQWELMAPVRPEFWDPDVCRMQNALGSLSVRLPSSSTEYLRYALSECDAARRGIRSTSAPSSRQDNRC